MIKPRYPNIIADKDFISSDRYMTIINRYVPWKDDFLKIGSWRWEGIFDNKELVASHVFDENQIGIDFGGYKGPIGGYTKVIDILLNNSLDDVEDDSLDYIFTSHCLEHIPKVEPIVETMFKKLKAGGKLIVLVPSFKKEVWRSYYAPDHLHTFQLVGDDLHGYRVPCDAPYKEDLLEIDTLLEKAGFDILIKKHVRTWCIFLYMEKKNG